MAPLRDLLKQQGENDLLSMAPHRVLYGIFGLGAWTVGFGTQCFGLHIGSARPC